MADLNINTIDYFLVNFNIYVNIVKSINIFLVISENGETQTDESTSCQQYINSTIISRTEKGSIQILK